MRLKDGASFADKGKIEKCAPDREGSETRTRIWTERSKGTTSPFASGVM